MVFKKWNRGQKMADVKFKKENYFTFNIFVLKLGSMWPIFTPACNTTRKIINVAFMMSVHILFFHIFVLAVNTVIKWEDDFDEMAQFITHSLIYLMGSAMNIFFQIRTSGIQELIQFLNSNFRIRSSLGFDFMTIQPSYEHARRMCQIWATCCITGVIHMALYPLIMKTFSLPIAVLYPFDVDYPPVYALVYGVQLTAQFMVGMSFGNLTTFYMGVAILLCGQYDVLFCSLKNVRNKAMLLHGGPIEKFRELQREYANEEKELDEYYCGESLSENLTDYFEERQRQNDPKLINQNGVKVVNKKNTHMYINSFDLRAILENVRLNDPSVQRNITIKDNYLSEFNKELTDALADCVEEHLNLVRCCQMMDDLYGPFMLIKLLQISFMLCFMTYNVSTNLATADLKFLNNMEYWCLAAGELFLFCMYGHMLTLQSERVGTALLRSPWHLCGGPFRRGVSILLEATRRPVHLTGGKFFILNLDTLRSLMSASFSYFTLLSNMQEKDS